MEVEGSSYHDGVRAESALYNQIWLYAKVVWSPEDEIGKFAYFDAADEMAHALGKGWVDCILADISLDAEVVCVGVLVFLERAALHLVLVRRVPGTENDFAATTHGLGVRGHH